MVPPSRLSESPRHGPDRVCMSRGWTQARCSILLHAWRYAANLNAVVANSRFLILPYVRVPHLASHLPRLCARQLPSNRTARRGTRPLLLETFVEPEIVERCAHSRSPDGVHGAAGDHEFELQHAAGNRQPEASTRVRKRGSGCWCMTRLPSRLPEKTGMYRL